ncbi:PTS sugar transporter subunit IIA [Peribacillus loiseleuriae]|uniref:PTS glucose transporter subunit IIA n=1 Tax=Peribacillus loiseleuriae TaxID=1679170 RepID=A0A0K9H0A1_9BACI|nr:PTS glucose transporter subunit IIA [Peribacillus loiseleuriae]KMY52291.1 PTS glucose transporter subunit IIA [Peribacillus loiseleuriae]
MFTKLFKKKEETPKMIELKAHMSGNIVPLEDVPDPVFAEKMMGDGLAIEPTEGKVVAPVKGEIVQVFPTKHAVGIKTSNGVEVLIHIGLETVAMNGEGFKAHVSAGEKVNVGDVLLTFDLDLVKQKAKSIVTPLIITNTEVMTNIEKPFCSGKVDASEETILVVTVN